MLRLPQNISTCQSAVKGLLIFGVAGLVILGGCAERPSDSDSTDAGALNREITGEEFLRPKMSPLRMLGNSDHTAAITDYYTSREPAQPGDLKAVRTNFTTRGFSLPDATTYTGFTKKECQLGQLTVPPHAFETADGKPYDGTYKLQVIQLNQMHRIAESPVGTETVDGDILQSQGMFYVSAFADNGDELQLREGQTLAARFGFMDPTDAADYRIYQGVQREGEAVTWRQTDNARAMPSTTYYEREKPVIEDAERIVAIAKAARFAQYRSAYATYNFERNRRSSLPSQSRPSYLFVDYAGTTQSLFSGVPVEMVNAAGELEPAFRFEANRTGYLWVDTVLMRYTLFNGDDLAENLEHVALKSQIESLAPGLWAEIADAREQLIVHHRQRKALFEQWLTTLTDTERQFFEDDNRRNRQSAVQFASRSVTRMRFPVRTMGWVNLDKPAFRSRREQLMVKLRLPGGQQPDTVRREMVNPELRIRLLASFTQGVHRFQYLRDPATRLIFTATHDGEAYTAKLHPDDLARGQLNVITLRPTSLAALAPPTVQ